MGYCRRHHVLTRFFLFICTTAWAVVLLRVESVAQQFDSVTLQQLADKVPADERLQFSQMVLEGATRGLEPDSNSESLNSLADSWVRWASLPKGSPQSGDGWLKFLTMCNQVAINHQKLPVLSKSGHYLRISAQALPIDAQLASGIEHRFVQWEREPKNVGNWGELRISLSKVVSSAQFGSENSQFDSKVNSLFIEPSGRKWNDVIAAGTPLAYLASELPVAQVMRAERGIQRIVQLPGWQEANDKQRETLTDLGRTYVRFKATKKPVFWENVLSLLGLAATQHKLETVVTFTTLDSKLKPKGGATVLYKLVGSNTVSKSIMRTMTTEKLDSGNYEVWAERDGQPTTAKQVYLLISDAEDVPLFEQ